MKRLIILTTLTCLFVGGWVYGQCNQAIDPLASFLSEDPNDPNEIGDPNDPDELIDPNDLDEVDDPNDPGE
jgi:hypothetical protein